MEAAPGVEDGRRLGHDRPHFGDGRGAVAALGGEPRAAAAQLGWLMVAEDGRPAGRGGFFPPARRRQTEGTEIVGIDALRVQLDGFVQSRQPFIELLRPAERRGRPRARSGPRPRAGG